MKNYRLYSFVLFLLLMILWELIAGTMSELILPAPSVVLSVLWDGMVSGYLLPHLYRTSLEVILGLFFGSLIGLIAGMILGEIDFLRRIILPYVIASQAVPKLALAPLFILWFGFGMTSKVVITALICFFPFAGKHYRGNSAD